MFRLAHVTDPHFRAPRGFPGVRAAELLGKRAVGYLNLTVNRVRKHKMDLLEDMRVDLRAQAPDHLALTGDLSNIALTSEWRSALAWLDLSGVAPDAISVIPGNHDAYVPEVLSTREFERLFAPYQTSDLDRDGEAGYYPSSRSASPWRSSASPARSPPAIWAPGGGSARRSWRAWRPS
jgi:3',5'-cyclic AMP phosphodiesterase CpdA